MPLPWFLHPCTPVADGTPLDGVLCYEDDLEVDLGEDRPFLVTQTPGHVRPPPPEYSSGKFQRRFGSFRPICSGHCLVANFDRNNLLWVTMILLSAPAALWLGFVAPELAKDYGQTPLTIALVLISLSLGFLILTWLVEPGILPHVELEDRSDPQKPSKLYYVLLDGQYFLRKTFRAQNSKFTSTCIEGFDHYCPYVGNAIGKRNYRYFVLFLTSTLLLCAFVVASTVALVSGRMDVDDVDFWKATKESTGATVLAGYCLIMGVSIASLLGYHIRIMIQGLTTFEDLKARFPFGRNPNNRGCWGNCLWIWCTPHFPSRVADLKELPRTSPLQDSQNADILSLNESLLFSPNTPVADPRGISPRAHGVTLPRLPAQNVRTSDHQRASNSQDQA